MRAEIASPFAQGIDTVTPLTAANVADLRNAGVDFAVRYLGGELGLTPDECKLITDGGLALMPVTYADHFDGLAAAIECHRLGIPASCTVWLDVESTGPLDFHTVMTKTNAFGLDMRQASFDPGGYFGNDTKLTSAELSALAIDRYWHSCSRVVDRNGMAAEPSRGWCMIQLRPDDVMLAGVKVDRNIVQMDYRGDLPTWAVA